MATVKFKKYSSSPQYAVIPRLPVDKLQLTSTTPQLIVTGMGPASSAGQRKGLRAGNQRDPSSAPPWVTSTGFVAWRECQVTSLSFSIAIHKTGAIHYVSGEDQMIFNQYSMISPSHTSRSQNLPSLFPSALGLYTWNGWAQDPVKRLFFCFQQCRHLRC